MAMTGGRIDVGGEAPWRLDDADVAVIVLNNENGSVARLWALQLLMALPYPLADVTEMFAVTSPDNREMLDLVGMLRNECAVVMDTRKRKVVFIVTAPVNVVEVAGVQLDVARPARGGELGDAQAVDLRPMLVNALNLVLTSTQPLRDVVAPWISRRCSSSNVDWALIDELVAWLTMRLMPQPEAARTAAGQHMSRGLPPAYIDQALGTERVPLPAAGQVFGSYFHEDAVTYTDNTFVEF